MSTPAHLSPEAARLLDADCDSKMAHIKQLRFVLYPAGLEALEWLSYLRRLETGRDRPRNLHLIGGGGIGKSRLLKHYAHGQMAPDRDAEGRRWRSVILVEAPVDGDLKRLADNVVEACIPGFRPQRRGSYTSDIERVLTSTGVRQILIDEAGNLLNAGKSRQQHCLAFIKHLTNLGFSVAIATTENMRTVLAADDQLLSRFKVVTLPKWSESNDLRGFLHGVETQLPLPAPSHLDSQQIVRWLISHRCLLTGAILELIRDAAHYAFLEHRPCLDIPLLERTSAASSPPDGRHTAGMH